MALGLIILTLTASETYFIQLIYKFESRFLPGQYIKTLQKNVALFLLLL